MEVGAHVVVTTLQFIHQVWQSPTSLKRVALAVCVYHKLLEAIFDFRRRKRSSQPEVTLPMSSAMVVPIFNYQSPFRARISQLWMLVRMPLQPQL
jgi:hypothetical protein